MVKTYILNQKKNSSVIIVTGRGGNKATYTFTNGNVSQNEPATKVVRSEYYQKLLEESDYFRLGIVKLDPKSSAPAVREPLKKAVYSPIPGVKSVEEATNYCATEWGETCKTSRQAQSCANSHGYEFVDLRVK